MRTGSQADLPTPPTAGSTGGPSASDTRAVSTERSGGSGPGASPRANWRSSTGSPARGPDLSLSRARDPTPDGTTAEVDSQANKKEFIIFFLLLNNAKSNQKNMQK